MVGEMSLREHQDVLLWSIGMTFILCLSGLILGIGSLRGWDADSGYTHNSSSSSQQRFLPEPFIPEPGVKGRYGPDAYARWYYWKLPPIDVTVYTRLFVWLSYVTHQVLVWMVTFIAQQAKSSVGLSDKYSPSVDKLNVISFGLNVFFHLLHLLQTHVTYDGLAQDTSVSTSQGSVIMLVIFILLIELKQRGLFFGWPSVYDNGKWSKKIRPNYGPTDLIRRYHGYGFSWAVIYTFWFHPMENTWGHVVGFILTWMVMLQGSLMFTKVHLNRYWRLLLESFVIIHGAVVAVQTGGPSMQGTRLWPMFTFGFLLIFVVTQNFSFPFWRKIHFVFRFIPLLIYLVVVIYMYSWIPDKNGRTWVRMQEIIRIPMAYYFYLIYVWLLLFLFLKIESRFTSNENAEHRITKKWVYLALCFLVFVVFMVLNWLTEFYDILMSSITLMIIFVAIFMTGVCIVLILMKQILGKSNVTAIEMKNNIFTESYSTFEQKQRELQKNITPNNATG